MAACIYNNGCEESAEPILPDYIQAEGSLVISNDSECEYMVDYKQWYQIHIGENVCNEMTSLTLDDTYFNLMNVEVGSQSLQSVESALISICVLSINYCRITHVIILDHSRKFVWLCNYSFHWK